MKKALSIAASAVILAILLVGAGSVAYYSNNTNCRDCHEMRRSYDSWKVSTHSNVSCTSCHHREPTERAVTTKGTAIARIFLHFVKAEKNPKAHVIKENCLRCHSSIRKAIKASTDSHVANPHPAHLAAGFNCTHCHNRLFHPAHVSENTMPQMKDCIKCHQLKEVSIECKTCHFGTQEHIDKIANAGGYVLKKGESCKVCHTKKNTNSTDHKKAMQNIGGYNGIETCSKCHIRGTKEVESGVHSKLKTAVAHVPGVKEEMGMANVAAKPALWAHQLERKDGSVKDSGCGGCHVGGSDLPTPQMASKTDCLICHAKNYDMKKRRIVKTGGIERWVGDDSLKAAVSVGKPVASYCRRCHEDRMDYRRGTPFTPEADVHAKAGMSCQSCHVTVKHKVAKGSVADMMANDIPELTLPCISCHVDHEHGIRKIDVHLKRLACQSCHIGRVGGLAMWDRTTGIDKDKDGLFEDTMIDKRNISPAFFWFDGSADEKGQPVGSRADKRSRIFPFKVIKLKVAVDPETKRKVNGNAVTFAKTGSFDRAVEALSKTMGLPRPPKWVPIEVPEIKQLNHAIKPKGMDCTGCHSQDGIMDFKALGYSEEEVKALSRRQDLGK